MPDDAAEVAGELGELAFVGGRQDGPVTERSNFGLERFFGFCHD